MTTHEIISAAETPCGNVVMKIRWNDTGHVTQSIYPVEAAKALGWTHPDPQPVDPAWMVEVAREACGKRAEAIGAPFVAEQYRTGDHDASDTMGASINALRLALSRGHVVLAPVMPSEEEMLKGAREDAAQANEAEGNPHWASRQRMGNCDDIAVRAALQARRNVYASLGAVAGKAVSSGPVVPEVDLRRVAKEAWNAGYMAAGAALGMIHNGLAIAPKYQTVEREKDVSAILENLKSGEA